MGRRKIEWAEEDYQRFEALCAIQCTEQEICSVMKVTDKTLNRLLKAHYHMDFSECYKRFSASGKVSLRRYQFRMAKKNPTMAIWLGKQYLGQRDQSGQTVDIEDVNLIRKLVFGCDNDNADS